MVEFANIDTWRSEALTSLSSLEDFDGYKEQNIQRVSWEIFDSLTSYFPIISLQKDSLDKFRDQVIRPAVELALKIQTSMSTYRFIMPNFAVQNCKPVNVTDLYSDYRFIDTESLKTLKPTTQTVADQNGFIGETVLPFEPVLQRQNEGAKSTLLCQGTYLISLDAPLKTGITS